MRILRDVLTEERTKRKAESDMTAFEKEYKLLTTITREINGEIVEIELTKEDVRFASMAQGLMEMRESLRTAWDITYPDKDFPVDLDTSEGLTMCYEYMANSYDEEWDTLALSIISDYTKDKKLQEDV